MNITKQSLCKDLSLSIVVTTYNSVPYLERLFCNLSQLELPSNFEIIFVDDASSDGTVSIIEDHIKELDYCQLIKSKSNHGPASARNKGAKQATLDYIFFWDADDLLESDIFVKMLSCACQNPQCTVIASDTCWQLDNGRNIREGKYLYQANRLFTTQELLGVMSERFNSLSAKGMLDVKGKLIKLSFIKSENIYFDESLRYLEDEVFLWHLFSRCEQAAYIREQLYIYKINESAKTGVIDGLLKEFDVDSLHRISAQAYNAFKTFGCTSSDASSMSERVFVYFAVNVLISSAKSSLQGKVSVIDCNAFITSLILGINSSEYARSAFGAYVRCEGESRILLIAIRSRISLLVRWAAFRRARKILQF